MNLLAIDSAGLLLSVALSRGDEIFYEEAAEGMRQSELVMDFIDSLLKKASLKPCDLNGILCMGGPGSFTGLRIGYSIAKGLALSLSIPFATVPTLDCIACQLTINSEQSTANCGIDAQSPLQLAVIQARKNAWFYAFYKGEERLTPDGDGDAFQIAEEIKKYKEQIILTGPGSALLFESLPEEKRAGIILKNGNRKTSGAASFGYAQELLYIAKKINIPDNKSAACLFSGPEYIRKTDAELNFDMKAGV